jgi:hypothetical protein
MPEGKVPLDIALRSEEVGRQRMEEFVSAFTNPVRTVLGRPPKERPYQGGRRMPPDVVRAEAYQMTEMLNAGYDFDTASQTWRNPNAPEGARVLDAREDLGMVFRNLEQKGSLPEGVDARSMVGQLRVAEEKRVNPDELYQVLMQKEYGTILGKLKM